MSTVPVSEGFRLSAQQRRAWSQWQTSGGSRAWCALLIRGRFDAARLHRAAEALSQRHEILRTAFHRRPGMRTPFQVVSEGAEVLWTMEPALSGATPGEAVEDLVRRESEAVWDLASGPLFRLRVRPLSDLEHVLLVTLPALCADRASLHEVCRQLAAAYTGTEAPEESEPIQYADYAQWQEDLFKSADDAARAGLAYWRSIAASGARDRSQLETPREGNANRSGSVEMDLPPLTVSHIETFCSKTGSPAPDFFLAAWQTLLARLTGESDLVLRVVDDGRHLDDLTNALGRFATALPTALSYAPERRFSELVSAVGVSRRAGRERADYFNDPEGAQGASSWDPEVFGFEMVKWPELPDKDGVAFSLVRDFAPTGAFAAWLDGVHDARRLRFRTGVDLDGFGPAAAERLAGYFQVLIGAAATNPETPAGELPLLTEVELRQLIVDRNATAAAFPHSRCVHELFEDQAARTPEAPALIFEAERLTYRELNRRANRFARRLRGLGVGADVPVGLCLERSAETIIALLGVLKAGGAYVPLIPDHPGVRLASQLEQSGCKHLITHSRWEQKLAEFPGATLCVDRSSDWGEEAGESEGNLAPAAAPGNLAYIMHTSGSTGAPKGVAVRHESLVNYSHFAMNQLLHIDLNGASLTFATVSTVAADLGNTAIFPSLLSGGCLHIVPYETAMEGPLFAEYLARNPIDVLKIVPSHFGALLASGGDRVLPRRFLVLGGEPLPWDLVEAVQALRPKCEIVNHYGPTETTVGSLTYRVTPGEKRVLSQSVPIGRPIANTAVFILDSAGWPVAPGAPGELYIGGAGVAAGYVGRPEETLEQFVAPRFSGTSGRLYRTGDRARYLPDGNVEFLGRADDQVKIRGYRVEPGEVRAIVRSHPGVQEAVVIAREDAAGDRRLVAYVVPRGPAVSSEALRSWLKARLPDYMVPAAFVALKSIPLTANGKVDRPALPSPEQAGAERAYIPPRSISEERIAETWREVLKLGRVGVEDNFFDLGGHSLLLTQVASRLRKVFKRELPIRWLFEVPTVAGLAGRIDAAERDDLARILDELEALPEQENDREFADDPPYRA